MQAQTGTKYGICPLVFEVYDITGTFINMFAQKTTFYKQHTVLVAV
jgi:hypothetical protein